MSLTDRRAFEAATQVTADHRLGSPTFLLICELYLAAVLTWQFGVFGTFLVGDVGLADPALFAAGLVLIVMAPRALLMRTKLNIPLLLIVSWYLMSYLWNANTSQWHRVFFHVGLVPITTLVIIGFLPVERFIVLIKRLTVGVLALLLLVTAAIPNETTHHVDAVTGERGIPGWHGTFDHKNGMMAFFMVGLVTFWVFERDRNKRWAMTAAVAALAVLGQSGTGTATLVVIALASMSIRLRQEASRETGRIFALAATVVWVSLAIIIGLFGPMVVNFFGKDLTFTGRTLIWSAAWRLICRQPWIGYGLGGLWTDQNREPTAELTKLIGFRVGHAHNGFLELLIEVGIIGLGLYLMAGALAVTRLWRVRYRTPNLARWGLLICLTLLLLSLSEAMTFHAGFETLLFWLCVIRLDNDVDPASTDVWPGLKRPPVAADG